MRNFITKFSLALVIISTSMLMIGQSVHQGAYKPIPKDILPIVKHTKELSVVEIAKTDFSGEYTGQRFQYTDNKKAILRTYTYTMNIIQNGTNVSGTTTITADNGDFGVIKLRGMVIADKLYFEEYEILDQKKTDDALWCFKIGELQMGKHLQNTVIYGPTNSYTSVYYTPCSGGYTMLEKTGSKDITNTASKRQGTDNQLTNILEDTKFLLNIFPNPFVNETNVSYTIEKESKVTVVLYDINGALIRNIVQEVETAGNHTQIINETNLAAGVYIVKINIDGVVSSRQIIKTNN